MSALRLNRKEFIAVLLALLLALLTRAMLQVTLIDDGMSRSVASYTSYLLVPPLLLILLFPVLRGRRAAILHLFRLRSLNRRVVAQATLVGILLRLISWCTLVASVSFGWVSNSDELAQVGPNFSFQCRAPYIVILGIFVTAIAIPFVEELTSRAFVIAYLQRYGAALSIFLSAVLFAILHPIGSWSFAFLGGLVFATQYWRSGSLWPGVIAHATVNALIQLDWYCLNGIWNPPADSLPKWTPGIIAIVIGLVCLLLIAYLINAKALGKLGPAEGN